MTGKQSDDITEHVQRSTRWFRDGDNPEQAALAREISLMGVDPATAVLAEYFPDDTNLSFGLLVTGDDHVYQFGIDWPSDGLGATCRARGHITEWEDITATWKRSPHRGEIEAAVQVVRAERSDGGDPVP